MGTRSKIIAQLAAPYPLSFNTMETQANNLPTVENGLKLNQALFWDVQFSSMDIWAHRRFIIERVVSRGDLSDWNLLKKLYGKEIIKEEVVRIRSLDRKTVSFLSVYFEIAREDFRCCS